MHPQAALKALEEFATRLEMTPMTGAAAQQEGEPLSGVVDSLRPHVPIGEGIGENRGSDEKADSWVPAFVLTASSSRAILPVTNGSLNRHTDIDVQEEQSLALHSHTFLCLIPPSYLELFHHTPSRRIKRTPR